MIKPIAKILIRFELPKLLWTPAAGAIGSRFIEVMSSRIKPLLEMRHSPIDPDVAHSIKEFSFFPIAAPSAEQLTDSIAFFPFPGATTRIEQELLESKRYGKETVPDENKQKPGREQNWW
jgi:hypothetical protein